MDYTTTLDLLRSQNLITENDAVVACSEAVSNATMYWFGAIGSAIAATKSKHYILAVSAEGIKLFDIDKETGAYLNTVSVIQKSDIIKTAVALLGPRVEIKTGSSGKIALLVQKKFKGYEQKEQYEKVKALLKTAFKK